MGVDIATEPDIERLRMFSELQARENARLRAQLAKSARRIAKHEGLDAQEALEQMLEDVASDVNESTSTTSSLRVSSFTTSSGSAMTARRTDTSASAKTEASASTCALGMEANVPSAANSGQSLTRGPT